MSASLLESIYNGAASIAKPLSLAALLLTFFTLIIKQVVKSIEIPLSRATSQDAVRIILIVLKYMFSLSLVALIGGLLSYVIEFFLQDYVKKYSLIDSARASISIQDPRGITKYADELIKNYPEYSEGYHYRGIANFYARNYGEAVSDFGKALRYLKPSANECDNQRRDFVYNLAAAQAASKEYADSLVSMRSMENCWSEKAELFNYGKILLMNNKYSEAEIILRKPKLLDDERPDYKSRTWLEIGILTILKSDQNWLDEATKALKISITHDRDFARIISCGRSSTKTDPPGMIEDFEYEISILNDPARSKKLSMLREKLASKELCEFG